MTNEEMLLRALNGEELTVTEFHPQTNKQAYLAYAVGFITDPSLLPEPRTNEEVLLLQLCLNGTGGGGVDLPELLNPATAAQILAGYEAINQSGRKITGTNDLEEQNARLEGCLSGDGTLGEELYITDARYLFYGGAREPEMDLFLSKVKHPTKVEGMFGEFNIYSDDGSSLRKIDLDLSGLDFSGVESCYKMFTQASSPKIVDLTGADFSNVRNMSRMFYSCAMWSILGHENWDVSNVTDMSYMFCGASAGNSFTGTLDLSRWDTSKVQNFSSFLQGFYSTSTPKYVKIVGLENFKTGACTKFESMFSKADIARLDLSNWDMSQASSVTSMFSGANSLAEVLNFLGNNAKAYLALGGVFPNGTSASSTHMLHRLTFAPTCTTGGFANFTLKYCRFGRESMVEMFNSLPVCTDTSRNTITITGNPCVSETYKTASWSRVRVDNYDDFLAAADDYYGSLDRTGAKVTLYKTTGGSSTLDFTDVDEATFNANNVKEVTFNSITVTIPESDRLTDEDRAIATNKGWTLVE